MNIAVIGTGYVGLVAGSCFAESGNDVWCVDNDVDKVERLKKGVIPIYEPGLPEIVDRNVREERLTFTTDLDAAVRKSFVIFIAVGTPPTPTGAAEKSALRQHQSAQAKLIGAYLPRAVLISAWEILVLYQALVTFVWPSLCWRWLGSLSCT